jgi:hypothetical protein
MSLPRCVLPGSILLSCLVLQDVGFPEGLAETKARELTETVVNGLPKPEAL